MWRSSAHHIRAAPVIEGHVGRNDSHLFCFFLCSRRPVQRICRLDLGAARARPHTGGRLPPICGGLGDFGLRLPLRARECLPRIAPRPPRGSPRSARRTLRLLRWAGHLARVDMSRLPRKLLTGWVAHPRPNGCPLMNWGRTLKKALKSRDIATVFTTWTKLAQNRSSWRQLIGDTTAAPTGPTARDERAARRNLRNNAPA